jgi:hypothetical protein
VESRWLEATFRALSQGQKAYTGKLERTISVHLILDGLKCQDLGMADDGMNLPLLEEIRLRGNRAVDGDSLLRFSKVG